MRAIQRLLHKAKQYNKEGRGRSMGLICRNYNGGGDWLCKITKMIKGEAFFDEQLFPTKDAAIEYGDKQLHDGEAMIIMDI